MPDDVREVRLRPVTQVEFRRAIRNGRVLSQTEDATMYRVGHDMYMMYADDSVEGGWWHGVARGHFASGSTR